MALVYVVIGFYLGLFVHQKGWLTFDRAAYPWVKLAQWVRYKFGGGARYYNPGDHGRHHSTNPQDRT